MRAFATVDVFGDGNRFGNPVAVVLGADGLDDAEMARIANWTNLSETTFVLEPTVAEADYRVRIFTTARELPFAGHPTLGTAHAWREAAGAAGRPGLVQECAAGLIALRDDGDGRLAFAAPPLRRSGPLDDATLAAVLETLGLERDAVLDHAFTDNGPGWASVLLDSAERVLALAPAAGPAPDVGVIGLHPDGTPEVRAFVAADGVAFEDPATGSLNAGLAQWLIAAGRLAAPWVARQGTALGRSGRIHVDADADGAIWVGGQTRTVVEGTIAVSSGN